MRPPKLIRPYVTAFAKAVAGMENVTLRYIVCAPEDRLSDGDCFPRVQSKVERCGGDTVFGWAIWERPKVFIEAEFHALWQSPDGQLHDIAPRARHIPRILFLHDPRRSYRGVQVDNIRKPLTHDKDVHEFLRLCRIAYRLWNEGDLAHHHGAVDLMRHPELLAAEMQKASLSDKLSQRYGPWTCERIAESSSPP